MAGGLVGAAVRGAGRKLRSARVLRNFSEEPQFGAQDPLGFRDPLDYCQDEASFRGYREKELQHGRLARMSAPGMLKPRWNSLARSAGLYLSGETPK